MVKNTILIVDDEKGVLNSLRRLFRREGFQVLTAASGQEALEILSQFPVQLVISDQMMPDLRGIEFLQEVKRNWPEIIRVMISAQALIDTALAAINQGEVYRFVLKPWSDRELVAIVKDGLNQYQLISENERLQQLAEEQNEKLQELNRRLETKVLERTREVLQKDQELSTIYFSAVRSLAEAVEAKDVYIRGHSAKVSRYSMLIAQKLGLNKKMVEGIRIAGLLHDIGKIGISDKILLKRDKLTSEEFDVIKSHPEVGVQILEPMSLPWEIIPTIQQHHERYDGKGYPEGIKGEKIDLGARIMQVADAYDAITSDRSYRKASPRAKAVAEIKKFSGTQFDPKIVKVFTELLEKEDRL
jgi:putative nucleotidyltransferase with HDIG domain